MSEGRNHQYLSVSRRCARASVACAAPTRLARFACVAGAIALALFAVAAPALVNAQALPGAPAASARISDVRVIAGQLRRLGLRVEVREITDSSGLPRAFLDFGARAGHSLGAGAFYYGSRGVQLDDEHGGVTVQTPSGLPVEAVGLSDLLDQIRQAHGQQKVVALDACPNEPGGYHLRSAVSHCLAVVIVPADSPIRPTAYATGMLRIRVEPTEANVRIDGSDYGNGPQVRAALPPGTHRIVVSEREYGTTTRDIQVTAGSDSDVEMTLGDRRFASASAHILPPP